MPPPPQPDFTDPAFLRAHAAATLEWWADPAKAAPQGGLHHTLRDDGSVADAHTRHLVSSTRLVVNFSWGAERLPAAPQAAAWRAKAADCFAFLRAAHAEPACAGAWRWVVDARRGFAALDGVQYA